MGGTPNQVKKMDQFNDADNKLYEHSPSRYENIGDAARPIITGNNTELISAGNIVKVGCYRMAQILFKAANTLREPGKCNFLLLAIIPLLPISQELTKHKDEHEERNLVTLISPGIYYGVSIYQNTCQLIISICMAWSASPFQDFCQQKEPISVARNTVRGNSKHQGVELSNGVKIKPPPPTFKIATPQVNLEHSNLQWPPTKMAALQTSTN